jgi:hypothetical protein
MIDVVVSGTYYVDDTQVRLIDGAAVVTGFSHTPGTGGM